MNSPNRNDVREKQHEAEHEPVPGPVKPLEHDQEEGKDQHGHKEDFGQVVHLKVQPADLRARNRVVHYTAGFTAWTNKYSAVMEMQ